MFQKHGTGLRIRIISAEGMMLNELQPALASQEPQISISPEERGVQKAHRSSPQARNIASFDIRK